MSKAYLDTTILANILLKTGALRDTALKALKRFDHTELPTYAIKEFKAGALRNFVYIHNKLQTLGSYSETMMALQKLSLTPQRYKTATSIEAIAAAHKSMADVTPTRLLEKYGENASHDKILCDEIRLAIKVAIFKAWKRRHRVANKTVCPLPCYEEVEPYIKRGLIEIKPVQCKKGIPCEIEKILKTNPDHLIAMWESIKDSDKTENKKRAQVLKKLFRNPKRSIDEKDCRYLGDAVFVFLAPENGTILTTNERDHKPLADAIGKKVETP
nr:hypothetical protein [uncultured Desulfobacter sp.]